MVIMYTDTWFLHFDKIDNQKHKKKFAHFIIFS